MIYLFLYLADIVTHITAGLAFVIGLLLTGSLVIIVFNEEVTDTAKKMLIASLILLAIIGFIPSKCVMYQMLGVKVGKDISAKVNLGTKINKVSILIDKELDKAIEEIK